MKQATEHPNATIAFLISQGFSPTILERFWSKVEKSQEPDGCWLWKGATNGKGYGKIVVAGHNWQTYAHRVSWMIHNGAIPEGLEILHNCPSGDNPACVNPAHMFVGTHKQNGEDMAKKGRAHKGFKLGEADILEIIRLRPTTTGKALALRFGVSQTTISQIVHGTLHSRTRAAFEGDLPPIGDQRKNLENYTVRKNQYSS